MASVQRQAPETEIQREIISLGQRVRLLAIAQILWDRVLTPNQRRRLGHSLPEVWQSLGTVGIWRRLHGVSEARAIVEIAQHTNLVDATAASWLIRGIGQRTASATSSHRPSWQVSNGELRFRGETVRLRVLESSTNLQRILDSFEAANWATEIRNPLGTAEPQATHQALHSLNKKIRGIQFHAKEGAQTLYWSANRSTKRIQSQHK